VLVVAGVDLSGPGRGCNSSSWLLVPRLVPRSWSLRWLASCLWFWLSLGGLEAPQGWTNRQSQTTGNQRDQSDQSRCARQDSRGHPFQCNLRCGERGPRHDHLRTLSVPAAIGIGQQLSTAPRSGTFKTQPDLRAGTLSLTRASRV
jgi:hypothetical protein